MFYRSDRILALAVGLAWLALATPARATDEPAAGKPADDFTLTWSPSSLVAPDISSSNGLAPSAKPAPEPAPMLQPGNPFVMNPESSFGGFFRTNLWLLDLDGDMTVEQRESDVDLSFGDTFGDTDFSGQMVLDLHGAQMGVLFDITYISFDTDNRFQGVKTEIDADMFLADVTFKYRLGGDEKSRLDLLLGARYLTMKGEFDGGARGSETEDFFDPVVGLHLRMPASDASIFDLRADIGGFDIGEGDSFTWQISGVIGFVVKQGIFTVGYRYYSMDYETSDSDLGIDASLHGILVGFEVPF